MGALCVLAGVGAPPAVAEGTAGDAVVAFVDTGINPYHVTFRDNSPRAFQHPSTYIPGYPADAIALNLTFNAPNYAAAVRADCNTVWKNVQPGKLYWFPGTRIVGGISFSPAATPNCNASPVATGLTILDYDGHGTMVASRGTSSQYGACKECLLVSVQWPSSVPLLDPASSTPPGINAITWAANNAGWIDAQSNSWGPIAPGYDPTGATGLVAANPALVRAVESVSQKHLAFWASGNGAAFRGGVLGHPTPLTPHLTPSAISVGGHDSGYVNVWPGFPPHLVSDSCNSWAARRDHLTESGDSIGGGTSAATPFVAGGAAAIVRDARTVLGDTNTGVENGIVASGPAGLVPSGPLADGVFTLAEWRRVLYTTATARPTAQTEDGPPCSNADPYGPTPVKWTDMPADYPEYVNIGYGAVDGPAKVLAGRVLRGLAPLPDRADTDQFFAADATLRGVTHQVFRGV
jgi:hypothetical protein